jgi:hypothetical protein
LMYCVCCARVLVHAVAQLSCMLLRQLWLVWAYHT